MKTKKLYLLPVFALALLSLNSCLRNNVSDNYVPQLKVSPNAVVNSKRSVLSYNSDQTIKIDSVNIGDTVTLSLVAHGFANSLKKIELKTSDPAAIGFLMADSIKSIFSAKSDFVNMNLVMIDNVGTVYFPFKFVAEKETVDYKMEFTVTSDADPLKVSNTNTLTFRFPIKP